MATMKKLLFIPVLLFALVSCDDSVKEPRTGETSISGTQAYDFALQSLAYPSKALDVVLKADEYSLLPSRDRNNFADAHFNAQRPAVNNFSREVNGEMKTVTNNINFNVNNNDRNISICTSVQADTITFKRSNEPGANWSVLFASGVRVFVSSVEDNKWNIRCTNISSRDRLLSSSYELSAGRTEDGLGASYSLAGSGVYLDSLYTRCFVDIVSPLVTHIPTNLVDSSYIKPVFSEGTIEMRLRETIGNRFVSNDATAEINPDGSVTIIKNGILEE